MSSNAAASNRSNSSESGSRTAPQVITYYRDVGDEVDSHFSRALLSSSSSESHRTDSRSSGSSRSGSPTPTSSPFTSPIVSTTPLPPTPTQNLSTAADDSSDKLTDAQPKTSANSASQSTSANSTTLPNPQASSKQLLPQLSQQKKPVIVSLELSSMLIHPKVDSYSDAPRVPGQLSSKTVRPTDLQYIPSIAISNLDLAASHCGMPQQHVQYPPTIYSSNCYASPSMQTNCPQKQQYPNSGAFYNDLQTRNHQFKETLPIQPTYHFHTKAFAEHQFGMGQSYSSLHQPSGSVPLSHQINICSNSSYPSPVELSYDDVHHVLAL